MEDKRRIHIVSNDYSAIQPFIRARNERIRDKVRKSENELLIKRIAAWGKWVAIGLVALGLCLLLARSFFRYGTEAAAVAPVVSSSIILPDSTIEVSSRDTSGSIGEVTGSNGQLESNGSTSNNSSQPGNSTPIATQKITAKNDKPANNIQPNDPRNRQGEQTERGQNTPKNSDPVIRYVPVPDPKLSKTIEKTIIVEKPVYIPIDVPTREGVNTEFTVFRTYELEKLNSIIVTGWNFPSSAEKEPISQYCYIDRTFVNSVQRRISLARITGRGPVVKDEIPETAAVEIGLTLDELNEKSAFCDWFTFNSNKPDKPPPEPIGSDDNLRVATGSGFFISKNGILVTNQHVVKDCNKFWIRLNEAPITAKLLASSEADDLALLKLLGSESPVSLRIADQLRLGEQVVALGFPLGNRLGAEVKVTTGNISSLTGLEDDQKYLQFTAPIQPGNSGGPLLNDKGLVVGVNTASLVGSKLQNINFAVKTERLIKFLAQNKQSVEVTAGDNKMEVPDLVQNARSSVVQVLCLGREN